MPVSVAKRRGSEKTPAPTMPPTTMAVRVMRVTFWTPPPRAVSSSAVSVMPASSQPTRHPAPRPQDGVRRQPLGVPSGSPHRQLQGGSMSDSVPSAAYGVHSEVGKLRKVLVCSPGLAHERLTPTNCDDVLFDDVLWVWNARRDHVDFVDQLRNRGVEVVELHEILAETMAQAD